MIEIRPGVSESIADAARASLDKQVQKLREEGKLNAGVQKIAVLDWTPETEKVRDEFKKNVDLSFLSNHGLTNRTVNDIDFAGPKVYADVELRPKVYTTPTQEGEALGIIALGKLRLPDIGNGGSKEMESGTVAYISGLNIVIYRSCGGGRAIFFSIIKPV